jgi:TATA-box binding protein (TBP) (component of TFIID and TFIIIB)
MRKQVPAGPLPIETVEEITQRLLEKNIPQECIPTLDAIVANFNTGVIFREFPRAQNQFRQLALALPNTKYKEDGKRALKEKKEKIGRNGYACSFSPSLMIEVRKPARGTVRLWKTGSAAVLGAKNEADARLVARKCLRTLQKRGFACNTLQDFRISNILGGSKMSGDFEKHFELDLHKLHAILGGVEGGSKYEPEFYPALSWQKYSVSDNGGVKIEDARKTMTINVYSSGGCAYTGFRHFEDVLDVFEHLWAALHVPGVVKPKDMTQAKNARKRKAYGEPKKSNKRKAIEDSVSSGATNTKKRRTIGKLAGPAEGQEHDSEIDAEGEDADD